MTRKSSTALLSVASNSTLIAIKIAAGILTGSVSIISEAIHSTMDLAASLIAFISVRISDIPPDRNHPYGHEKVENVSGIIEALLILSAAVWIIYEAVKKVLHPEPVSRAWVGLIVMAVSAGINQLVSFRLYRVSKQESSLALEADALHLRADVLTSAGIAAGMAVIWLTKVSWIDSLLAVAVAVIIVKEAVELLRKAFEPLLDASLSDEELRLVEEALQEHLSEVCDYHELRTRSAGKTRHIDMHITLPPDLSVKDAHDLATRIESAIESKLPHTMVLIHIEPCDKICEVCKLKH
jgi:cation diffusion facilitator family transporter